MTNNPSILLTRRFNLVFHGMIAFFESGENIEAVIPIVDPHRYKHGQPNPATIMNLPAGKLQLTGVSSSGKRLADLLEPTQEVVLDPRVARRTPGAPCHASVSLPKPDRIRLYRASEVDPGILGKSASWTLAVPRLVHGAAVFSYIGVPQKAVVRLSPVDAPTMTSAVELMASDVTRDAWCIYAQPDTPNEQPHDISAMTNLVQDSAGRHPDFQLSNAYPGDSHTITSDLGFNEKHLYRLDQLAQLHTIPGGCDFMWCPESVAGWIRQ